MIFTGIEIMFFVCGVLTTLFAVLLYKFNKTLRFKFWTWLLLVLGAFLLLFTFAWSVSSVIEGVPRSASMGMVVFGIPSIVLILLGMRLAKKSSVNA